MNEEPTMRRRRRLLNEPVSESASAEPAPTARRKRKKVTGATLKLQVPERPGYFRRWFVDRPGRLAEAEELAYEHVLDQSLKADGTDSRVRRLTGTDGFGAPQYSYLMETPIEEYRAGIEDKEEAHAAFEASILRGSDPENKLPDSYGGGRIEGNFQPG
jgi:hypothetical protein